LIPRDRLRTWGEGVQDPFVTTELNTLATALYVKIDDALKVSPGLAPVRPRVGFAPTLSDAELVTLAVMSALLGFVSERRWLRYAAANLRDLFPYLPQQSGYNRRLRAASGLVLHMIRLLAADTSLWSDDVWVVDSTPVECGRSRETVKRSNLAGRSTPVQTAAADYRIDQPDLQSPARPGTTRRAHPRWGSRPHPCPHTRDHRSDLTQRPDRSARQAVTDRLRPLTVTAPLRINHLEDRAPMAQLGWKSLGVLELTALPSIGEELWVLMVQEADALLVEGGDPMYLSHWLHESDLADLLPTLRDTVYVGLSAGSMVMTPNIGDDFVRWSPPGGGDKTLGIVDFAIFPHLDHPGMPGHSMANAEKWAATMPVRTYAIDAETAIKVTERDVEVVSEGNWKLFSP
jgi:dipeptidase E